MKIDFPEYHLYILLKRFENQHLPLDLFLSLYFRANRALGSKDRQVIAQAAYGMIRWQGLLDYLLVQPTWEKRYTLFKKLNPDTYLTDKQIPPSIRASFPEALYQKIEESAGPEMALSLCRICNTEAPITVRINPLKTKREDLITLWTAYGATPCATAPFGIQFKKRGPLTAMPEFKEGLFEIQDEASQIAADCVDPQPGQHVLDFCAGAGGKTLAFAHKMEHKGQIYLHDIRPHILEQAKKRLKRAGIQNAQFLMEGDKQLSQLKKKMDWVLADVPCSGTGTLRRNPDQKWKFSLDQFERLIGQQRVIFERALSYLKPDGKIVYATCSILPEENERQVDHFLHTYGLELLSSPFRSLPTVGGMDGFFAAVLTRK